MWHRPKPMARGSRPRRRSAHRHLPWGWFNAGGPETVWSLGFALASLPLLRKLAPRIRDSLDNAAALLITGGTFLQGNVGLGYDAPQGSILVNHRYPSDLLRDHDLSDDLDLVFRRRADRSVGHQFVDRCVRPLPGGKAADSKIAVGQSSHQPA